MAMKTIKSHRKKGIMSAIKKLISVSHWILLILFTMICRFMSNWIYRILLFIVDALRWKKGNYKTMDRKSNDSVRSYKKNSNRTLNVCGFYGFINGSMKSYNIKVFAEFLLLGKVAQKSAADLRTFWRFD